MPIDSRLLVDQFPTPTAVFEGPDHIVIAASASYRQLIGGQEPIGQPLGNLVPDLVEPGFIDLVDDVLTNRRMVSGTSVLARWDEDGDGVVEEHFIDYILQPLSNEAGQVRRVLMQVVDATARVHGEREERFLAEASDTLASSLDYDVTIAEVARLTVRGMADWCAVDEIAPDGSLRRIAVAHPDPEKVRLAHQLQERYPPDPSAPRGVHHVIRTGVTEHIFYIPDELVRALARDEEHARLIEELQLRSYICVPLRARGHTLGAMTLVCGESGRLFGPRHVRLAEELARRASVAIDNARLFRDSEESRQRLEEIAIELEAQAEELQSTQAQLEISNDELQRANEELERRATDADEARAAAEAATARVERLQAVAAALSDAVSPAVVAEIAVEHGRALFGAGSAALACLDARGTRLEMVHAVGFTPEVASRFQSFPVDAHLPLSDAVRERRPVYIGSDAERAELYTDLVALYPSTRQHAWASIPLMVEGRVLGGIALGFDEPRSFAAEERSFLEALGQQCAQALERARLFEAELRARRRMEVLADAGILLATSLDLDSTLRDFAHLVVPRVADWCFIEMPGADGRIDLAIVHHEDPATVEWAYEVMGRYPVDPQAPFGTAWVLRTGKPELIEEIPEGLLAQVAQSEEHLRLIQRAGFHSYLSVPLRVRGRTLGVLSLVMGSSGRRFGSDDLGFAQELARRASTAIENVRLYEAERNARTEAEEANRAKTEFLSAMSHELRTPLNAIAGYVDVLDLGIHGPLTDTQRKDLERIKRNQEILLGLISDVLNFARVEAGRIEYSSEAVEIEPLLRGLEEVVGPQVLSNGVSYEQTSDGDGLAAWGDPDRIQQILLNLLTNAVKFTSRGGAISVRARADADRVVVDVTDTGRGIPPDKLEAIFDPFVQVDRHRTDSSQQGVGLGLAISRQLARGMGGDLTVRSLPDEGSTFTVTLPRAG
jgi:signal transduction histidine kinase